MPVSHILALSLSQTPFSAAYTYMQEASSKKKLYAMT